LGLSIWWRRIPEHHQHLVNDVDKDDTEDLFVKVYGLAARDPKRHCKVNKNKDEGASTRFSKLQPHGASMGTGSV
jgi:hypothetical protein